MSERRRRPSQIFASRLRETRAARNLSQGDLASLMRAAGLKMSKASVLRLEKENPERGEGRVLSLDEALAFAAVLNAVPAHLLSPRGDGKVWLTDEWNVDSAGLRAWLLHGYEWIADASEYKRGERAKDLERVVLVYAQALLDAARGGDKAGEREALAALARTALQYREQFEAFEQGAGLRFADDDDEEEVGREEER